MSRTPLLDQLRASYQRDEDEIRAPIAEERDWQARRAESMRRQLCDLTTIIGRKVGDAIFADMGRDMARTLCRLVREACAKHDYREPTFTMVLPTSELRWLNPDSLERLVLEGYLFKLKSGRPAPRVSSRGVKVGDHYVTHLAIDIPSLTIERAVS